MGTSPIWALTKRELVAGLRRTRSLLCLAGFLLACACVTMAMWPREDVPLSMAGYYFDEMLSAMMFVFCAGALLLVPPLAATSVVSEREQDTFDLVRMTLVGPSAVIFAKLFNAIGVFILLATAAFPILAVSMFGIGLDWLQVVLAGLILLVVCVISGVIGVFCSCLVRRSLFAIVFSYLGVILYMGGVPMAIAIMALITDELAPWAAMDEAFVTLAFVSSPPGWLIMLFENILSGDGKIVFAVLAPVYHVAWCLGLFFLARYLLYRDRRPKQIESQKPIDDPAALSARRKRFPFYLIDPLRRKPNIEDRRNPMRVRELRWGLFARGTILVRIFYGVFVISLFPAAWIMICASSTDIEEAISGWFAFEIGLLALITPALLANTFTKEYELGNLDMLRMTLISPRRIVMGKVAAACVVMAPAVAAVLIGGLPLSIEPGMLARGGCTLIVCVFVALCLALVASMLAKRTTTSIITGYVAVCVVFLGLFLGTMLVLELAGAGQIARAREEVLTFLSPLVAYVYCENAGERRAAFHAKLWVGSLVGYAAFAWLLLEAAVQFFARFRMQER